MSALFSKFTSLFSVFSSDLTFLISIFIILLVFALYFGKGRMVSFILAFYPATLLYKSFPFTEKLIFLSGDKLILLNKLAIFLAFFAVLNIIINRYIFSASEYTGSQGLLRSGGLAVSAMVLVLLFTYTTLNLDLFHDFSPTIDTLFTAGNRVFYWNILPLAILALL